VYHDGICVTIYDLSIMIKLPNLQFLHNGGLDL
jgi:hypothetical protein